jgi:dipeptidyl aminopeptidase/acylaminoacyl peptidase
MVTIEQLARPVPLTRRWCAAGVLVAAALSLPAPRARPSAAPAPPARFELTLAGVMRGPALTGYPPTDLRWSGDGRELFFERRLPGEDEPATFVLTRADWEQGQGTARRLDEQARRLAPPADGRWDRARRRALFVEQGDIVLIDSVARTRRQITRTSDAESAPRWAGDERQVTFVRGDGVYRVPVDGSAGDLLVQLIEAGPARRPKPPAGPQRDFLEGDERQLLQHVRRERERRERREREQDEAAPLLLELRKRESVQEALLAPDGRWLYVLVARKPQHARATQVPDYIRESAYADMLEARTKVGDEQETRRLAVVDLEQRRHVWVTLDGVEEPAAAADARASAAGREGADEGGAPRAPSRPEDEASVAESESTAEAAPDVPAKPAPASASGAPRRVLRWSLPVLAPGHGAALVSVRAVDNKDRWLARIDPVTGRARVVDRLHDDAWMRELPDAHGWLPDGREAYFLSERSGFLHLYAVDTTRDGAEARALTAGRFELQRAELAPDQRAFLFISNESHAGERQVYRVPLAGGSRTRLTTLPGTQALAPSPDGRSLAFVGSRGNQPPEVYVSAAQPGAPARVLTDGSAPEWRSYPWIDPPVIEFAARDGVRVPARLFTPESVGARRAVSRPGVVFVHGAGYTQNAHRYWATYAREYLFHHLLAARGYVVLDVDYRGSAGYGRDWRTAIYRHMGGQDLNDVLDAARYLVEHERVDPARVGVYGGSYGGFLTLMAMFTAPDTFAAGAALRPVTDWAHYNDPYTSNILDRPQDDPVPYRRSSPIHHAEGLKGALLIAHGMVDVNVHFQDSVRLAQRLIELRKTNWELAAYPVEDHTFEEETSWADQYRRVLELFERVLAGGATTDAPDVPATAPR